MLPYAAGVGRVQVGSWWRRGLAVSWLLLVAAVALGAPAAAEAGDPPFDPGGEWVLVSSREDPTTDPAPECGTASEWAWEAGEQGLTLYVVPCEDRDPASGMWEWLAVAGDVVPGASEHDELVLWDGGRVVRAWIAEQGAEVQLAVLTTTCGGAGRDACVSAGEPVAEAAIAALPGGAAGVNTPGFTVESIGLSLVVPVVIIAIVVAPVRLARALARPRFASSSSADRYHDVTPVVSRARWRRRVRRLLWWVVAGLVFIGLTAVTTRDPSLAGGALVLALLPLILVLVGRWTFLRPHPVERGRRSVTGLGAEAALGTTLSVLAVALAVLVLLVHVLLFAYAGMFPGWPSLTGGDLERMDLPLLAGLRPLLRSMGSDAALVSVLAALPLLVGAAAVDALGQRLRTASLDDALAQDDRPHYLYLRSFDEDRLTLTAHLRRRGLVSALSMMRRVRFEEVMVRQLSATGPVIAIAPPGSSLPPIGAARASFSNDEWQQHVTRYAETARAVVLSATPGEIRPGYGWELDLIANRIGHQRVLVVLGPWPLTSLRRRWVQFCQTVAPVPFFAPITMPWVPDGVHLLAHSPRSGWHAWGATRRLDWTYAVALDEATRAYLPDWS